MWITIKNKIGDCMEEKKKPMSEEGKRITAKLEKLTGIKLSDDEVAEEKTAKNTKKETEDKSNARVEKEIKNKPVEGEGKDIQKDSINTSTQALQDIKDVDLSEEEAIKPLLFKCPNDIRLTIKKDNGEYIIDESCCTTISVIVKNTGEIATNFSGSHNPDLVKILSKAMKRYMRELKKKLKADYKEAREELKLKREDIPDDMKFDKDANVPSTSKSSSVSEEQKEEGKELAEAKKSSTSKGTIAKKTTKSTTIKQAKTTTQKIKK